MIDEIARRLQLAKSVFVLTGSGISAESGLPTFRGVGGLWRTHRVEELASPEGFARDPHLVWSWYNERRAAHKRAEPSPAHLALARLEARFEEFTLATQNVDSLHLRAGSQNVLELHGNLREAYCNLCAQTLSIEDGLPVERIEHACGGLFRPRIVWFGESLPQREWILAAEAASRADVKLIIGTSAIVQPAASLAFGGDAWIVEINPEATAISDHVDASLRARASDALTEIESRLTVEA
ncbi:MAG TPA: NAD-dependent deacylase [Candidatus Baltobacteraceae bacterium]|jgi:NAD-dependent deacetylase